ncbi:SDR family oxidoreductase [Mycolicibacterium mucogenicum]|uniref:NAD(P)-dependent oxidoreductase n=1 Tax=Mycolicibacterium mucogenicum DSM 44124 TaxID=1226753 RepID=A0A8H2JCN4_MYCMU|nr:NAD(P)-dependent oxidoreductase [Mycolicibacterium mucogenicum]KAB7758039.1 short-chain dehydrogenase [Mycolicibacterium mucogenicum DSM 44124]QPG71468.1 NAD(P)-dependent oxidoreductase [Mycolicibacterium mucogenicum DSM 44124]
MNNNSASLADRTMVVSGGSRGIGLAIGIGAARLGANVVLLAKTSEPHPKLPGTVHTAVAEVEAASGKGLAVVGDVRNEADVQRAVDAAVERFGGIDIVVNNASAIATEPTETLPAKKFDLMMDINVRGTFLLTKAALPYLRKSTNAHVLTVAPPLNMNPYWLGAHPAYTVSKYGMTLLSLGWAAEYSSAGIGFSCLWPETYIATSAVANSADLADMMARSRSPEIMADAAVAILTGPAREANGKCYIDTDVLAERGVIDLSRYGGGADPIVDIFVDR